MERKKWSLQKELWRYFNEGRSRRAEDLATTIIAACVSKEMEKCGKEYTVQNHDLAVDVLMLLDEIKKSRSEGIAGEYEQCS